MDQAAAPAVGPDVGGQPDFHLLDPLQAFDGLPGFALDLVAQRAGRRGQFDGEADPAAVHGQVLDHVQTDQIAMELGLLHLTQGVQHRLWS